MEVIVTHLNADFDSLGSMIAAKKLYPEAKLVFPGAQEKSLRDFLVRSTLYILESERLKDVDLGEVRRLIVVDTRQRSRIGKFVHLLQRPEVEIHIYDHHPPSPDDFHGHLEVVEERGANTTIMTRLLRERGIEITPEEATVMMLGIYEDTGSFTYPSTTEADFQEAGYLLSCGADLRIVSEMMTREMTSEQVFLLNQMIENAETYNFHGVQVIVTTAASERYIAEAALLVHKMMDMENPEALFALLMMEDKVYLIARSRAEEVDVAKVALEFGGGGHPTAASATLRGMTTPEAKERLLKLLSKVVRPRVCAKEIMTSPLRTIEAEATLGEAYEVMRKYGLGVLPVMKGEEVVGLISKEVAERGVIHGLADRPVGEYMTSEIASVSPEASLWEVYEHIVVGDQRLLPVIEGRRLLGGITRTDLLRALYDFFPSPHRGPERPKRRNVLRLLEERLPGRILELLRELGRVGDELGYRVYAVGGFVRDLLLGRENLDVDVVVEGDGVRFAQVFSQRFSIKVKIHKRMGTATLLFPSGYRIDVATARMEYYPQPAAPPAVEHSSLKMDLLRRDFTINTLAVDLNPSSFGELVDFFGAQRDLKEGVIRVLHSLSFVEDPSRIFRALRFEARFGFQMGRQTESLMRNAIASGFVDRLSGARLFAELRLILQEENPLPILERMEELGLLKVLHPRLTLGGRTKQLLKRTHEVLNWYDLLFLEGGYDRALVYMYGLLEGLKERERVEMADRLSLTGRFRRKLLDDRRRALKALSRLKEGTSAVEIYWTLEPFGTEVLLFILASAEDKGRRKLLSQFISQWRKTKVALTGRELQELGLPPGPLYQRVFKRLLEAHLQGEVKDKADEVELVRREFLKVEDPP